MTIKTKIISMLFLSYMVFLVLIGSVVSCGVIISYASDKYILLCLLPLGFGLFSIIFRDCYSIVGKSITITLLLAIMFLRSVITPVMMSLGADVSISSVDTTYKISYAVFLLLYEQFAIWVMIYYFVPKIKKNIQNRSVKEYYISRTHLRWFTVIALLLALIVAALLVFYPLLSAYYEIGISGDEATNIKLVQRYILMDETVPKIPRYLFELSAKLLRWMIPIIVVLKLYLSKMKNWMKVILSMAMIVCVAMVVSGTIATSFFLIIAAFFLIYTLYEGQGGKLVLVPSAALILVATSALFIKNLGSGGELEVDKIAGILQAYFAGPDNVAIAAMIEDPIAVNQILGDTLGFMPYIMHFFKDLPNTRVLFNAVFWGALGKENQIIPMIAQGARYFTPILAPILTVVIVRCALAWEKRALEKHELLNYAIGVNACVCFAMGVGMYSASLVLQLFLNYIFPLMFIYHFISVVFCVKHFQSHSRKDGI